MKPITKVIVIVILYLFTEVLSGISTMLVQFKAHQIGGLIRIVFFSIFVFGLIPKIYWSSVSFKSHKTYLQDVGLIIDKQFWRLILLSIGLYLPFVISQSIGSYLYNLHSGTKYYVNLQGHSFDELITFVSATFEEIVFRGVVIGILIQKVIPRKAVLISAIVFAFIHGLNALNPEVPLIWALSQVIWAFTLGILYGTILIKFRSVIPCILLHITINAMVGVWFVGLDKMTAESALWNIPFYGLLPAVLGIFLIKPLARLLTLKTHLKNS